MTCVTRPDRGIRSSGKRLNDILYLLFMKVFRFLRRSLLAEGKLKSYGLYAIGEIFLVVLGILIAIQIDNWYQAGKLASRIDKYRSNLIAELQADLSQLDRIRQEAEEGKSTIGRYIDYYNKPDPNMDTLVRRMQEATYYYSSFSSVAYSIDEIIAGGFLSNFQEREKQELLALKATHSRMKEYHSENIADLLNYTQSVNDAIDVLHLYGFTEKEHEQVRGWRYDLASPQLRLYNNELAAVLQFYESQAANHGEIRQQTQQLITALESNR